MSAIMDGLAVWWHNKPKTKNQERQFTQTPKKQLCYSDLSHQNLIDNMTRHGFPITFPTCTQLIYSLQSHSRLTKPSVLPAPSLLAPNSLSPPSDDINCQVSQSPFDEYQMLLCDIYNAGWHMDCLLPPLLTPHGIWKCPLCLPHHLLPQTETLHLRLPSPILNFDSDSKIANK